MNVSRQKSGTGISCKILAGIILSAVMVSTALAKDKIPEVSKDGLHLVKDREVAIAYVKPGTDFSQYTKVKILDCFVQFKKNWQRDYNLDEVGLDGRVTDKDAEKIKKGVAEEFHKVFTTEMTKAGHEVVDDVGPDVLLLRPAIINLDVTAPDVMRAGIVRTVVTSAGEMTLYLELYDSATSTLLARVIDPQSADRGGQPMLANKGTNKFEADRVLRRWANLLNKHLGEVTQQAAQE